VPKQWATVTRSYDTQCIVRTAAALVRRMVFHTKSIWFSDIYFLPSSAKAWTTSAGEHGYDYDALAASYFPDVVSSGNGTFFDGNPLYDPDDPYDVVEFFFERHDVGPPVLDATAMTIWLTRDTFDGSRADVARGLVAYVADAYARGALLYRT
jgi:hypothetical protein